MTLDSKLGQIKGVGGETEKLLKHLGLQTVFDLIDYYPRTYKDYSSIQKIIDIAPGEITVKGQFTEVKGRYVRNGLHITQGIISDETSATRVTWFNQPYRATHIKPKTNYYLSGKYDYSKNRYQITNPSIELESNFNTNTARIIPIYRETKGLKSHSIRKFIYECREAVGQLEEVLPPVIAKENDLYPKAKAIWQIHFPDSAESLELARKRLAFEELFELQLAARLNKLANTSLKSTQIKFDQNLAKEFTSSLPFELTNAQKKVAWEILQDFEKLHPANRLVEGDVGSGKTVVAAMLVHMASNANVQSAVMAPTELLANQHFESFKDIFKDLGVKVALLTANTKNDDLLKLIKNGEVDLVIGTHALIQDKVEFKNLGFAVIDEQHRFGVNQRQALKKKAKNLPHLMAMTATPIPRSLALTLYGELDISIIDELPVGRKPIGTKVYNSKQRLKVVENVQKQLDAGHQAFWVCPKIDADETWASAEVAFEQLTEKYFTNNYVALIHGKMKSEEQQRIMAEFNNGKIDVLVATTVVEVGVDVPNATAMVVESAERFGLAQLHQLRGRIGRSDIDSHCYPITDSSPVSQRLKMFESSSNGFELAEYDLDLRGAGAIFGTRQSGALDLRIANISDRKMINAVKSAVDTLIGSGDYDSKSVLGKRVEELRKITKYN